MTGLTQPPPTRQATSQPATATQAEEENVIQTPFWRLILINLDRSWQARDYQPANPWVSKQSPIHHFIVGCTQHKEWWWMDGWMASTTSGVVIYDPSTIYDVTSPGLPLRIKIILSWLSGWTIISFLLQVCLVPPSHPFRFVTHDSQCWLLLLPRWS